MRRKKKTTQSLSKVYYNINDPAGFGGVNRLKQAIKHDGTENWLKGQLTYSLHKPIKRKFPTRSYRTSGLNDVWQLDLMEMIPYSRINKGYKYILTCIDVFSRFARAYALKSKQGQEVAGALESLFDNGNKPIRIQTDLGKEFYNSHVKKILQKYKIHHYSVYSQFKASLVERFNRTLREKLNRYFTYTGKKVWYDILDKIVNTYNHTKHRSIQNMRPMDVNSQNEMDLWLMQEKRDEMSNKVSANQIPLLDYVRISHVRGPFLKNFDQNWSDEVFRVIGVNTQQEPTMYVLEDLKNNVIQGKFYRQELQSIGPSLPQLYRVEKILQSKGVGKYKQYYVKWVGYDSSHNSWIYASSIE